MAHLPQRADVKVVFVASGEHGHNTPMLALAHELQQLCKSSKLYWITDSKERGVAAAAGAEWIPMEYHYNESIGGGLPCPARQLQVAIAHFDHLAAWLVETRPHIVVYDYFCVVAPLVCKKLNIPYVCFRSGQPPEAQGKCPEQFAEAQQQHARTIANCFGVEVDWQAPWVEPLSPLLNIVQVPLAWLAAARNRYEPCATIGPSIVPRPLSLSDEALLAALDRPGASFRALISMGTVQGQMADPVIKDQQSLFQLFVDATRLLPEACVVLSISGTENQVNVEALGAPTNCLVRSFVPQLAVLGRVDVFLSHCGANSLHEALWAGVPILGVPVFGDQPDNARRLEENGWGVHRLWQELTPESVASDLKHLATNPDVRNAICRAKTMEQEAIATCKVVAARVIDLASPDCTVTGVPITNTLA